MFKFKREQIQAVKEKLFGLILWITFWTWILSIVALILRAGELLLRSDWMFLFWLFLAIVDSAPLGLIEWDDKK